MADKKQIRKVTTPKFRVSFEHVFTPQAPMEGQQGDPKYGLSMLFDASAQKTPAYKAMMDLAVAAAKEKFGDKAKPDGKGWFHGLRHPFRDGNEKSELEGYEGCMFASATSKMQPGLVDQNLQRIISTDDFYSGCYARATVTAYGYDKAGNKGVAFGLQNVQKLADGDRFSGRTAAEDDFEAVDDFVAESDDSFMQ
ncbi:Cas4 nuclease superfamily protein [Pseudomonas phage ZQG1]|nr:Cas4 nuclease superfamily protein [Pseudomonas phage ZQG1]